MHSFSPDVQLKGIAGVKITRETPEIRSDKRKPRKEKEREKREKERENEREKREK